MQLMHLTHYVPWSGKDFTNNMTLQLHGHGVSNQIAIGTATIIPRGHFNISQQHIAADCIASEQKRYRHALKTAKQELIDIGKQIPQDATIDVYSFIDTHLLMLDDSTLFEIPLKIIKQERCNAEWALQKQHKALTQVFDDISDPYLQARKDDITHVVKRIQRVLLQATALPDIVVEKSDHAHQILIIDDLSPEELIAIHQRGVAGFITEYGGPLSHTAILARGLGIPALVGTHGSSRRLQNGETLILDGERNALLSSPDKRTLQWYRQQQRNYRRRLRELTTLRDLKTVSIDEQSVALQANIELPADIIPARKSGCTGIGLYRTEYLFMNRDGLPGEEEQYRAYRSVIRRMRGAPVTIRTLDLGADKQVDSGRSDAPLPTNPALGLRAIRLCLQDHQLFHTQLRAILRAAVNYDVRIMIPMISTVQEIRQTKAHISAVEDSLRRDKIRFASNLPVGTMIEVPAVAITADNFARHCDFLSIGTNDLIQYTLAIDRVDDSVNYLYDPLHPAILKLIAVSIKAAKRADIPISMCGEMAGDTRFTRLLLGMGLRDFSMPPSSLLQVKEIISKTDTRQVEVLAKRIVKNTNSATTYDLLHQLNQLQ